MDYNLIVAVIAFIFGILVGQSGSKESSLTRVFPNIAFFVALFYLYSTTLSQTGPIAKKIPMQLDPPALSFPAISYPETQYILVAPPESSSLFWYGLGFGVLLIIGVGLYATSTLAPANLSDFTHFWSSQESALSAAQVQMESLSAAMHEQSEPLAAQAQLITEEAEIALVSLQEIKGELLNLNMDLSTIEECFNAMSGNFDKIEWNNYVTASATHHMYLMSTDPEYSQKSHWFKEIVQRPLLTHMFRLPVGTTTSENEVLGRPINTFIEEVPVVMRLILGVSPPAFAFALQGIVEKPDLQSLSTFLVQMAAAFYQLAPPSISSN